MSRVAEFLAEHEYTIAKFANSRWAAVKLCAMLAALVERETPKVAPENAAGEEVASDVSTHGQNVSPHPDGAVASEVSRSPAQAATGATPPEPRKPLEGPR